MNTSVPVWSSLVQFKLHTRDQNKWKQVSAEGSLERCHSEECFTLCTRPFSCDFINDSFSTCCVLSRLSETLSQHGTPADMFVNPVPLMLACHPAVSNNPHASCNPFVLFTSCNWVWCSWNCNGSARKRSMTHLPQEVLNRPRVSLNVLRKRKQTCSLSNQTVHWTYLPQCEDRLPVSAPTFEGLLLTLVPFNFTPSEVGKIIWPYRYPVHNHWVTCCFVSKSHSYFSININDVKTTKSVCPSPRAAAFIWSASLQGWIRDV